MFWLPKQKHQYCLLYGTVTDITALCLHFANVIKKCALETNFAQDYEASNQRVNEQLLCNLSIWNMQVAKKRDVIQQIRVQIRIQHPQISLNQFSMSMQEKKFLFC